MADSKNFAEQLVNLTVKEVNEFTRVLKDECGIEPAAAAVAAAADPTAGVDETAAERTEFDVVLESASASRLTVVKLVKDLAGLGLKEAKEVIDGAPLEVEEGVSKEEAEGLKRSLREAGAKVELK